MPLLSSLLLRGPRLRRASWCLCVALLCIQSATAALDDDLREATRLHHAGQGPAALQRVDAYLAAKPKDAQMRFLKSVILADTGRYRDASAILEQLAQDYPELPEPHNNLAAMRAAEGDWPGARRELEETLRLRPNYAPAHENLGDVYVMLAADSYRRALSAEPASASLPRKLALVRQLATPMVAQAVSPPR